MIHKDEEDEEDEEAEEEDEEEEEEEEKEEEEEEEEEEKEEKKEEEGEEEKRHRLEVGPSPENQPHNLADLSLQRGTVEVGTVRRNEISQQFNQQNSRHMSARQQLRNTGQATHIFPELGLPPHLLHSEQAQQDSKDLYNGKMLQRYLDRNLQLAHDNHKLAMLIAWHPRIGSFSPLHHAFVKSPLCDPQLLRGVWDFAFD
eukprot:gb/GEZN01019930.1/.p1 GENE.gb/GEZN01019930.1/~~gb/GEZN01019930.1/.p1  ORF type:complete len:201 (+),score=74.15 gb/GEZN01019930.1/:25-627(+)